MDALKPCPFCAGAAILNDHMLAPEAWVLCRVCHASAGLRGDDEGAVRDWNRRDWYAAAREDARREGADDAQAEIARLRAVLEWMARRADVRGDGIAHDCGDAALRGDWDAVRAAGVALGEDNE